ncbi:regulator of G-protein signaling 22-like [Sycon ciliatum]|uniref:regulator of G-protein signaling 22-like n=1 Tax=Sycon ciliatum TaxID=27933 RepID=UPI0031F67C1F
MKSASELDLDSALEDSDAFVQLLRDTTFVDYLNAYLANPATGVHLFFNARTNAFEELLSTARGTAFDAKFQRPASKPGLRRADGPDKSGDEGVGPRAASSARWTKTRKQQVKPVAVSGLVDVRKTRRSLSRQGYAEDVDTEVPQPPADFVTEETFLGSLQVVEGMEYVRQNRLPGFQKSTEFIQYLLCKILTASKTPQISNTAQRALPAKARKTATPLDQETAFTSRDLSDPRLRKDLLSAFQASEMDPGRVDPDLAQRSRYAFSRAQLDNVRSMKAFADFLKDTNGFVCWEFWIKAQRAFAVDDEQHRGRMLDDLKMCCIRTDAVRTVLTLPLHATELLRSCGTRADLSSVIRFLQEVMACNLYSYWIPRYLLHLYREMVSCENAALPTVKLSLNRGDSLLRSETASPFTETQYRFEDYSGARTISSFSSSRPGASRTESNGARPSAGNWEEREWTGSTSSAASSADQSYGASSVMASTEHREVDVSAVRGLVGGTVRAKLLSALESDLNLTDEYLIPRLESATEDGDDQPSATSLVWLWRDIQAFNSTFERAHFKATEAKAQAQLIASKYILPNAPHHIPFSDQVVRLFCSEMSMPLEMLFDEVEEELLVWLEECYAALLQKDETALRASVGHEKSITFADSHPSSSSGAKDGDPLDGKGSTKTNAQASEPVCTEMTFEDIIRHRQIFSKFQAFLNERPLGSYDFMCWSSLQSYRHTQDERKKAHYAKLIRNNYLTQDYFYDLKKSPATKQQLEQLAAVADYKRRNLVGPRPSKDVLYYVESIVLQRLQHYWIPRFTNTEAYKRITHQYPGAMDYKKQGKPGRKGQKEEKQKDNQQKETVNQKQAQHMRDVALFRKSLKDRRRAQEFLEFLQIRGGKMEKNLVFWIEVQRFKLLCHHHASKALMCSKAHAIVNCFLNSCFPPTVAVSVSEEAAECLTTRAASERWIGPYMFQSVQLEVFDVLFPEWIAFTTWRSNHYKENPDSPLPFSEMQREKTHRQEEARKLAAQHMQEERDKERQAEAKSHRIIILDDDQKAKEDAKPAAFRYSEYLQEQERVKQEELLRQQQMAEQEDRHPTPPTLMHNSSRKHGSHMPSSRSEGNLAAVPTARTLPAVNTRSLSVSHTGLRAAPAGAAHSRAVAKKPAAMPVETLAAAWSSAASRKPAAGTLRQYRHRRVQSDKGRSLGMPATVFLPVDQSLTQPDGSALSRVRDSSGWRKPLFMRKHARSLSATPASSISWSGQLDMRQPVANRFPLGLREGTTKRMWLASQSHEVTEPHADSRELSYPMRIDVCSLDKSRADMGNLSCPAPHFDDEEDCWFENTGGNFVETLATTMTSRNGQKNERYAAAWNR